jgi:transmembrane sensor
VTDLGTRTATERVQSLIAEQAAGWLIRLEDASEQERLEFANWLRAAPAHVLEFLKARAVWEAMGGVALLHLPEEAALLRELQAGAAGPVVPLRGDAPAPGIDDESPRTIPMSLGRGASAHGRSLRTRFSFGLAASVALLLVAGTLFFFRGTLNPARAGYETSVGEQSAHTLPDGSSVVLNTRSRVRLNFSDQYRDIHLESGEALFDVARDPRRPFRVWSGDVMVRALGTRFNVYRDGDAVTVTVLEGRVEATSTPISTKGEIVQLAAGERARLQAAEPIRTERLQHPERVLDWQSQRLVFEHTPLTDVIGEFNRYSETPLRLEDPALAAKRINGIFDATDRASLIRFLEEFEDVEIEARDGVVLVKRRGPTASATQSPSSGD